MCTGATWYNHLLSKYAFILLGKRCAAARNFENLVKTSYTIYILVARATVAAQHPLASFIHINSFHVTLSVSKWDVKAYLCLYDDY